MRHRRPAEPGRPRAHDPVGGDEDAGPVLRCEAVDPGDDLRLRDQRLELVDRVAVEVLGDDDPHRDLHPRRLAQELLGRREQVERGPVGLGLRRAPLRSVPECWSSTTSIDAGVAAACMPSA